MTSDVDPPPSRFSAASHPSAHIRRGELGERQARVAPRAAVAGEGDDPVVRHADRRARVAPLGDVGVELPGARAEALGVPFPVEHDPPAVDEHGARLEQVTAGDGRELVAPGDPRDAAVDVQAAAHGIPRLREGHVPARDAVGPHLAQCHPVRPCEEAADDRVADAARGARLGEPALRPHHGDLHLRPRRVEHGHMHRGDRAVAERDAQSVRRPALRQVQRRDVVRRQGKRCGHPGEGSARTDRPASTIRERRAAAHPAADRDVLPGRPGVPERRGPAASATGPRVQRCASVAPG